MNGKFLVTSWYADTGALINLCFRLLYDMDSPRASSGRGLCFGRIFRRDGTLVATTAQEGIIRLSLREQEKRRQKAKQESKI
jgi:Thioesterase-like superfamily